MKNLIIILAVLFFSTSLNSKLNAIPADSCLWVPIVAKLNVNFYNEDIRNRDSTIFIDTCSLDPFYYIDSLGNPNPLGGIQYIHDKRYYSKSVWGIEIPWIYFDTTNKDLNTLSYFTVDDIDPEKSELFDSFQKIKQTYGTIKFWFSLDRQLSIGESWYDNGNYLYIETDNLVNSLEFEEFLNELLPNVSCKFLSEISYHTSVKDSTKFNNVIKVSQDYLSILIESHEFIKSIIVYSLEGFKVFEQTNKNNQTSDLKINISTLPTGIYLIQVNDNYYKFTVVR